MFHEYILQISNRKYIKTEFLISDMQCKELTLGKFKGDFLNILIVLHPQITDIFQVALSRLNNVLS